jgi:hypothetical protein
MGTLRISTTAHWNLIGKSGGLMRDEKSAGAKEDDDLPTRKRPKLERFPFTQWEFAGVLGIFFVFFVGLIIYIYSPMPYTNSQ